MGKDKDTDRMHDNYLYNDMLARAMVQLFSAEDRSLIHMWLEKLQSITGDKETLITRNEYTCLLLLVLQSGTLTDPFNKLPPTGQLPRISDVMSVDVFKEMLSSADQNFSWIDRMIPDASEKGLERTGVPPYKFLDHQPQPVDGLSCYFSVFSRRS